MKKILKLLFCIMSLVSSNIFASEYDKINFQFVNNIGHVVKYKYNNASYQNALQFRLKEEPGTIATCQNIVKNNLQIESMPEYKINYSRSGSKCTTIITNPYLEKGDMERKFQTAIGPIIVNMKSRSIIGAAIKINNTQRELQKSLYPLITDQNVCFQMCGTWEGNTGCSAQDNAGTQVNPICSNYSLN